MKIIRSLLLGLVMVLAGLNTAFAADKVNINTATAVELAEGLGGIGMTKAQAIVKYRESNGYFNSIDQLSHVKGIGDKTVDRLRGAVVVDVPLDAELKKKGYK